MAPERTIRAVVGTVQHGIATRKEAEALDHFTRTLSIVHESGNALTPSHRQLRMHCLEQVCRIRLQAPILGMFQRQVGERPLQRQLGTLECLSQTRQGEAWCLDASWNCTRIDEV